MIQQYQPIRLRFASFELDLRTGELWKNGRRIRLQDQPAKLLSLLVTHPGELVTRMEIQKLLWNDQFVEVDHGINAAMKKSEMLSTKIPIGQNSLKRYPKKVIGFSRTSRKSTTRGPRTLSLCCPIHLLHQGIPRRY